MNLDVLWRTVVSTVTQGVHAAEVAFSGILGAGPQKKAQVLDEVGKLVGSLSLIFPLIPQGAIIQAAGDLVDAVVAVSNVVGFFQHGGQLPDKGDH